MKLKVCIVIGSTSRPKSPCLPNPKPHSLCLSPTMMYQPQTHYPPSTTNEIIIADMHTSILAVESLLKYRFHNTKLLEDALTHPSFPESESYQRLEFLGDAALGLAITNYVYLKYPELDPGQLSIVRAANISTEKFARVAVKHRLYRYVRHNAIGLEDKVTEFAMAVEKEDDSVVYGGVMKAPKVLADIVESIAAALYVDLQFDLQAFWEVFRGLLEPIVTLEMLNQQPQPITTLFDVCQKDGKQLDIKHVRKGKRNIASVYVDGQFVASSSSGQKDNAKLHAAEEALKTLSQNVTSNDTDTGSFYSVNGTYEIDGAKAKLHELCVKKRWPKPVYRVEKELGPAHDRKYVSSVQIETGGGSLFVCGYQRTRVRDAEGSAASLMICGLKDVRYF